MQSTQQQQMIHIKATFGQDIRRFETEATYSVLLDTLRTIYHLPTSSNLMLKFLDDDQDWITFSSDVEFKHAAELKLNPLKLTFQVSEQQQVVTPLQEQVSETSEENSHERRGRCHRRRSHEGGMRGCHGRRSQREMKGCHEGKRGFFGGRGCGKEGPRKGMCGRKGGAIEGRFPHRRHLVKFEQSTLPRPERITQRINMIKSKIENGVKDEKMVQFLTFRLAKLQWKLDHIQKFDENLTERCTTQRKEILEKKEEKRSLREQIRSARKNEDKESILSLRKELKSKNEAIRKLKSETFDQGKCKRIRSCEPSDFQHRKVDVPFRVKCRK